MWFLVQLFVVMAVIIGGLILVQMPNPEAAAKKCAENTNYTYETCLAYSY